MTTTSTATRTTGTLTLVALALAVVAVAALESLILPVLPLLQHDFGVTANTGALASVALTLTTVITTPLAGRFADVYGARRVLIVLSAIVAVGGLVSAFAPVFPAFVAGQALQGFGLGVLPISFVVLRSAFSFNRIKTATGVLMAMTVVGGALAVLLAGPVAERISRTALYVIPTAVLVAATIIFVIVSPRVEANDASAPSKIDWAGAVLLAVGLVALVAWLAVSSSGGWLSPAALILLLLAIVVLAVWVVVERRVGQPMVHIGMLARRPMAGAVALGVAMGWAFGTIIYLVPQQLSLPRASGFGVGASATTTGLYLFAGYVVAIVASPLFGKLSQRIGLRLVTTLGLALLALSAITASALTEPWQVILALSFAGLGVAASSTAVFAIAASSVEEHEVGVATALTTIARSLGAALGTQVAGTIIAATADRGSFALAFAVGAIAGLVGVGLTFVLPRRDSMISPRDGSAKVG